MRRADAAGALVVACAVGLSASVARADTGWGSGQPAGQVTSSVKPDDDGYDGFFGWTLEAIQRSHAASDAEASFTQRALRLGGRFDYFAKDNKSALGSIPGIEGNFSFGWTGGAAYSGMTAGGFAPTTESSGGFLLDVDVVGNWSLVATNVFVWQIGPRLSFDFDDGLRDVATLSLGAAASTRLGFRLSDSTWTRIELDHQLADSAYSSHEQMRVMVAFGKLGVVGVAGTGNTLGSRFIDAGVSLAWLM